MSELFLLNLFHYCDGVLLLLKRTRIILLYSIYCTMHLGIVLYIMPAYMNIFLLSNLQLVRQLVVY